MEIPGHRAGLKTGTEAVPLGSLSGARSPDKQDQALSAPVLAHLYQQSQEAVRPECRQPLPAHQVGQD